MKINKLKKSRFKKFIIFIGSYHRAIKKSSYKKNILGAYTITNKKSKGLNCKDFLGSFLLCYGKALKHKNHNEKKPVFIGTFQKSPCLSHFLHYFTTLKH
jgi:hypothetical protein